MARPPADAPTGSSGTRGILNPALGLRRFDLQRFDTAPTLRDFVSRVWVVRWDLGNQHHDQEILPFPRVNVSFQSAQARVVGPSGERFVANLTGRGCVLGVRFEPAGFAAFSNRPMTEWLGAQASVAETWGAPGAALTRDLNERCENFANPGLSDERLTRARELLEEYLCGRCRAYPAAERDQVRELNSLIERAQSDRELKRAEQLAALAGCSLRSLQRSFERLVGVSPKWVLCRARAQEAAERISSGETVDWPRLALELGYHDQAHFIRDFKAQIGFTPTAYAARCKEG
ncbi:MAG: AraC family transcriptional regulator [Polyangiaceae bacterium]|nr:AraC family transcriptional regulator [Polyangiaceae bacterium]MCB9606914.1 AraC family transcriptional regulator [Polyangiaceae bacterium]